MAKTKKELEKICPNCTYEEAIKACKLLSESWILTGDKKIKKIRDMLENYLVKKPK